jgi:hypothetical protein
MHLMASQKQRGVNMGISDWYVGQLAPIWTIYLIPDTGYTDVTALSAGDFSLRLRNLVSGVETTGGGTFSSITAATHTTINGQVVVLTHAYVKYQLVGGDVAAVADYKVWVDVTFANGVVPYLVQEFWNVIAE